MEGMFPVLAVVHALRRGAEDLAFVPAPAGQDLEQVPAPVAVPVCLRAVLEAYNPALVPAHGEVQRWDGESWVGACGKSGISVRLRCYFRLGRSRFRRRFRFRLNLVFRLKIRRVIFFRLDRRSTQASFFLKLFIGLIYLLKRS